MSASRHRILALQQTIAGLVGQYRHPGPKHGCQHNHQRQSQQLDGVAAVVADEGAR